MAVMGLNSRQWPEAAMIMVLFTIAELIEAKSLDRARNAIGSLMNIERQLTCPVGDNYVGRLI
ncbi:MULTISPECIES: hypothetical protein [Alteromonadales]|mgnify:CR=1|uniref:hypothetical protein n=1 Tax=Alteromonadales TaxID=135622 RepID=UPI0007B8A82C|nr:MULTISPECIES: hypothetical protein [Alteromonadales]KZY44539.1 hypothetical protein A3733_15420 [Pseudoalteromonas shioyasakiensis]KZY50013.1 hypothetical protein A3733_32135 [Pseudoalteromonas shioyasakiensis]MCE9854279.1 hypothetical protein [Shewanella chilikensis]MDC9566010.1 hypothetical protein [Pseudoalteromonas sp. GAB2316C]MDC9570355.1 hypothetical protein [Pseudoalteromonas sp. GABNB9D]